MLLGPPSTSHRDRLTIAVGVVAGIRARRGRFGHSRRDGVDPDVFQRQLDCHGPGHRRDRSLGRSVGDVERGGVHAADRRDRHDRPWVALLANLAGHRLAHEERRLQVPGEQIAPVVTRHPGGGHPRRRFRTARHVDEPVQLAVGPPARSMTVAMPSSVDASAATATTDRPRCASGVTCSSRFSFDRLTPTTVAPASAANRVTVVPMPPPPAPDTTTMRPSSLKRSSMAVYLSGQHTVLCILKNTIPQRECSRQGRIRSLLRLLSGPNALDSVRGHDLGHAAGPLLRR